MQLSQVMRSVDRALRDNSPTILTAVGVSGTITTAYLAGRASFRAAEVIGWYEASDTKPENFRDSLRRRVPLVWKLYIPPVATGAFTVVCIISANRIGTKRAAAAYSLLTISERAYSEYRDKVIETIGEKKEHDIRAAVAQDRIEKTPQPLIIAGAGTVPCFEQHTGRYFMSDMESLRRAMNDINEQLHREDRATLSDFYHMVGLEYTTYSDVCGWESGKNLDLQFSSVLHKGVPTLAFDYNYIRSF